jgi:pimeloyl-ACP methyl ester carboxylesterase
MLLPIFVGAVLGAGFAMFARMRKGAEARVLALGPRMHLVPVFDAGALTMRVMLIHGLGRTPLSLVGLARDLRRAGHQTELVAYFAALESYQKILARVRGRIKATADRGEPYAIVGHSLGGLLARVALDPWPTASPLPRHLVLLGTPNTLPQLARRFHRLLLYRLVNGQCGQLLAQPSFFASLPVPAVPTTVIAGTRSWLAPLNLLGEAANDGIVAVSETRLVSGAAVIELPASHTFMMNNRQVRETVRSVLAGAA